MRRTTRPVQEELEQDTDFESDDEIPTNPNTRSHSDSEDAVYGVAESDSDIALSDVEGQDDDGELPDVRAWGKDKRRFYSTDYVDPDYGGYQQKDSALAEFEEEEASNLQKQLMQQLDDDDFSLPTFSKNQEAEHSQHTQVEEIIETDISKLSKRQKLQLLQKESPELFGLIEDFKEKIALVNDTVKPGITQLKIRRPENLQLLKFLETYYAMILNYCTNISMYLYLKASKVNIQTHPVVKRLYQYRQLLAQLNPIFDDIKPGLEIAMIKEVTDIKGDESSKQKLVKSLKPYFTSNNMEQETESVSATKKEGTKKRVAPEDSQEIAEGSRTAAKKKKVEFADQEADPQDQTSDNAESGTNIKAGEEDGRRGITYQIAKNKGLMPHRKKELRNPRVKHRNKYRKATIRRKGAVREVRKEMNRYGGEMSGIKASITKSIKIKS